MQRMRVGVLMGGRSLEREVSFNSGRTAHNYLSQESFLPLPLFQTEEGALYLLPPHFLSRGKITDFLDRLPKEAERLSWNDLPTRIDVALIAMHGREGEDGTIQGCLEILDIPYLGSSVLGSALGMNKLVQKQILSDHGLTLPRFHYFSPEQLHSASLCEQLLQKANLSYPLIVKPNHEGSSLGVSFVNEPSQLSSALTQAATIDPTTWQGVIVEEFVRGRECTCILLEKQSGQWTPLSITEILPTKDQEPIFTYIEKYMPGRGRKVTPAPLSLKEKTLIEESCRQVCTALHFSLCARIDGFLTAQGTFVIIDPNTLSGMAPSSILFEQAAEQGMSPSDWFSLLLSLSLKNWKQDPMEKSSSPSHPLKRVAVLMGGDSPEREISLDSGRNVCSQLPRSKYRIQPLFVTSQMELFVMRQQLLVKNRTQEIQEILLKDEKKYKKLSWEKLAANFDFIFLALHGGRGENGAIQGMLQMLHLPYNGSSILTSALCANKAATLDFLSSRGFFVSQSQIIQRESLPEITEGQKYVLKPNREGSSTDVVCICSQRELQEKVTEFSGSSDRELLLEEYLSGMELTIGILGNEEREICVFPPTQTITSHSLLSCEEKFLPGAGENRTPAPLKEESIAHIRESVKRAYCELGCRGYARIDGFFQNAKESPTGKERFIFLEVNTLPALTPATCLFHQAAEEGMTAAVFLDRLIQLGEQASKQKVASISNMR